jgi:hypothetical protein
MGRLSQGLSFFSCFLVSLTQGKLHVNQGLKGCYVMMSICGCEIMSSRNKSLSDVHFNFFFGEQCISKLEMVAKP